MKHLFLFLSLSISLLSANSQNLPEEMILSDDVRLIKLSENAYIHVSWYNLPGYGRFPANGLLLINNKQAFLFDTPWNDSLTSVLYHWICDTMQLQLKGVAPNHWHQDCMGGLGFLQSMNVPSYANQITIDICRSKGLPVPDIGFNDSLELSLGDTQFYLYYPGEAHSTDNIVVWIPSEKILFPACMVKSLSSTDLGNTSDGNVKDYPLTIEKLKTKFPDARIVIPGHGKHGGTDLIDHTLKLAKH